MSWMRGRRTSKEEEIHKMAPRNLQESSKKLLHKWWREDGEEALNTHNSLLFLILFFSCSTIFLLSFSLFLSLFFFRFPLFSFAFYLSFFLSFLSVWAGEAEPHKATKKRKWREKERRRVEGEDEGLYRRYISFGIMQELLARNIRWS